MIINSAKNLEVYNQAFKLANEIFQISKLTDADGKLKETYTFFDFAFGAKYTTPE